MMTYKGSGSRDECNGYEVISLLIVSGKVHGKIVNEIMMKIADESVLMIMFLEKRWECGDKIFALKMERKAVCFFIDLEKAYDS